MTTWITSDSHYYHSNIILYCRRPYIGEGETEIQEGRHRWKNKLTGRVQSDKMTEAMIRSHNELVKPEDTVYHLGDFTFGTTSDVIKLLRRLNGNYKFVYGNHDKALHDFSTIIDQYSDLKPRIEFLGNLAEVNIDGQDITLCHYPLLLWNKKHHGAWCLCGHSHYTLPASKNESTDFGKLFH